MASPINRARISLNVAVQLVTWLAIVLMLNYFAFNHYKRWDISRDQRYTLSEQSVKVIESLKKPADFIVFFSGTSDIDNDVRMLLTEYAHLPGKKVHVEIVDPFLNLSRAREVASKYKLGSNENVVIVDYDGRSKLISAAEMAEYEPSLTTASGPRLKAFKGEEALTSALIEVSEQVTNKVYAITGHGEASFTDDSLADIKTRIERQNIVIEPLSLAEVDRIPEDAKAVFIIAPKYDFTERDVTLLAQYWENKGRLLILFDPIAETPKLNALPAILGVTPNDDRVLRTVPFGQLTGVLKEITGDFVPGSPITNRLEGVHMMMLGVTQSLTLDADRVKEANIRLLPLVRASKGFWAEKDYEVPPGGSIFFNSTVDVASPVVAASVEQGALSDNRVQLGSSRLIVVGNSAFVVEPTSRTVPGLDFLLGGVNWLIDREQLIGITPKQVRNFSLNLSESQSRSLMLITMIFIPGAAALLGVISWLKRRH